MGPNERLSVRLPNRHGRQDLLDSSLFPECLRQPETRRVKGVMRLGIAGLGFGTHRGPPLDLPVVLETALRIFGMSPRRRWSSFESALAGTATIRTPAGRIAGRRPSAIMAQRPWGPPATLKKITSTPTARRLGASRRKTPDSALPVVSPLVQPLQHLRGCALHVSKSANVRTNVATGDLGRDRLSSQGPWLERAWRDLGVGAELSGHGALVLEHGRAWYARPSRQTHRRAGALPPPSADPGDGAGPGIEAWRGRNSSGASRSAV